MGKHWPVGMTVARKKFLAVELKVVVHPRGCLKRTVGIMPRAVVPESRGRCTLVGFARFAVMTTGFVANRQLWAGRYDTARTGLGGPGPPRTSGCGRWGVITQLL